ncbi:MAG: 4-hydroxythreonine-4-phosphate dehydrogenase PdxA [Bacteroidota bacterium]|nr:4-hydroxythreonine-4-phosphate dehydrogenase PdxA [Bacteroidota bacterium]
MKDHKIRIGITQGDINGISYEVIMKTLLDPRIYETCTPIVYGSPKVVAYHRKALNLGNFNLYSVRSAEEAVPKRANLVNVLDDNVRVELGKSTPQAGEASLLSLKAAVKDLKEGKIDAIVTGPINKHNIQSEEFHFPGHTEYLRDEFGGEALMILVSEVVKVAVVTGHVPLSKVASLITEEAILSKLKTLNKSMLTDFAVRKPRIAVLSLNPHAGDEGVIGNEETDIIIPAIEKAKQQGIMAFGPYAADGFFGSDSFKKFDAVLAMYHDQGLAPFKAMVFEDGVNFTAGLPIVRTSPAHGTAYELVGKDQASESSFRQALYMACDIYKNREEYKELTKNPMKNIDTSNV